LTWRRWWWWNWSLFNFVLIKFIFKKISNQNYNTSIIVGSKIGGGVGAFSLIVNGGGVGGGGAVCLENNKE
jgi:hypothetical protein